MDPRTLSSFKRAQASCRQAIQTARSIVKDFGDSTVVRDSGIQEVANCRLQHSEHELNRIAESYNLCLPVPLSPIEPDQEELVGLKLTNWAKLLLKENLWHILAGLRQPDSERSKCIWKSFWERYQEIDPAHPIYERARAGLIDLCQTAAVLYHGDEGRGRKRGAVMISNFYSLLGRGTSMANRVRKGRFIKHKLNYVGSTYSTRFLSGILPKHLYGKKEHALRSLFRFGASEAEHMFYKGVTCPRGTQHYMCLLHICGDWPFLMKCGNLGRGFTRSAKTEHANTKTPAAGVCHLCLAGTKGFPWEQLDTEEPLWLSTCHAKPPFQPVPEFLSVPHNTQMAAAMFMPDVWHNWHLGVGRAFLGSVIARAVAHFPGSKIGTRFESLSNHFLAWCRTAKRQPYISRITQDTINWKEKSRYPLGGWSKGNTTYVLMLWFPAWYDEEAPDDPALAKAATAAQLMNECLSDLYNQDLWIESSQAIIIARKGLQFLSIYTQLARDAFEAKQALWALIPKSHMLHHAFLTGMLLPAQKQPRVVNPMAFGCQLSEDFVGRPSRITRRVSSRLPVKRSMQRYLRASYDAWVQEGYLVPP